ncbi:MAG: DUF4340 domain-containing protein [Hyphomicrobiaceae bacterium]
MIKPQQFIGLAAATAVSVVLALGVYISNSNDWSKGTIEGAPFLPDLASRINSVGAVEITQGGTTLTLARDGSAWKVRERDGFPTKPEGPRALLVALAQAQLVEPRTAVAEKLSLLELGDPAAKDSKSRHVRVLDSDGKVISDVILGKTRYDAFGSGRGGVYVRRANETQSWLATGDPKVTSDLKDWIETSVYKGDAATITKVTIENPGEEPLVIEKRPPAEKIAGETKAEGAKAPATTPAPPKPDEKKGKYQLAKMPDGKKLKEGAKLDDIVEAFGSINLDDVRKLATPPTGDKVQVIKVEADKGPIVTFHLRTDGDAHWLSLSATGEGDAKKQADEINAKAKGWEYKIPKWKADQIGKRRADLFETT